jgi:hypothetical protein
MTNFYWICGYTPLNTQMGCSRNICQTEHVSYWQMKQAYKVYLCAGYLQNFSLPGKKSIDQKAIVLQLRANIPVIYDIIYV